MPAFYLIAMKKNVFLLAAFFFAAQLYGQLKHDYQWVLDHYNLMDFRLDTFVLSIAEHQVNHGSGDYSTSICNADGELQFYSGGCHILNREGEIMENGDDINSDYAYDGFCGFGDYPFPQSNTIIPFPLNSQKYIYFNLDINIIDSILPTPLKLYFHIIDMDMNGGLGAVEEIKQLAVGDTLARGYVQAAQNTNMMDWWVTIPELNSNCYYVIPVTNDGVGIPNKQCLGGVWNNQDGGGQAVFSPNGTKYARVEAINGWYLFDFDASVGQLSNPLQLMGTENANYFRGVAFSPNSRYLYVSARMDLFQFDLEADDVQGSIQLVGQLNPDDAFPGVGTLALQKLAPDGKIYIASPGSHKYLSVINRPNCPGTLCDFQPWAIELPESNYAGLPNLPHFSIPDSDNECDSLTSTVSLKEQESFLVFPNPATDKLFFQTNVNAQQYIIFDLSGSKCKQGTLGKKVSEIDVSDLLCGAYFLSVIDVYGNTVGIKKLIIKTK
ncbi:MAG: T9SS type A sorting domain-containing protein [Saprospiraceae bacterium]|nr:T9SS type A sorting domain-containing protein [Saprospiraceae bacterium]